jgi:hypothetical protein
MFFNKLSGMVRGPRAPMPPHRFVEKVVATLGESITRADSFEPTLSCALYATEHYYHQQIWAIPGPFDVSASEPPDTSYFRTIFPAKDDVQIALSRSIEVRDFLPALAREGHQQFFALLGVREGRGGGGDGPGPSFADHTIRSLGHSEQYCRESLLNSCLHRLLGQFREQVDALRGTGRWTIKNNENSPGEAQTNDLVLADKALQPDNLLKALVSWLESPEEYLRIESSNVAVTDPWRGRIELPLMRCADRRQWVVSLVEVSVQEALGALSGQSRCHRYILL